MKVEIQTPFANGSFDLNSEQAMQVFKTALSFHNQNMKKTPENMAAKPAYGGKKKVTPAKRALSGPPKYKGFLYIRCDACGNERGFCAKHPTNKCHCTCGSDTELKRLKVVHAVCRCGKTYTYFTNIGDKQFTMECMDCHAPMELTLAEDGNSYVMRDPEQAE